MLVAEWRFGGVRGVSRKKPSRPSRSTRASEAKPPPSLPEELAARAAAGRGVGDRSLKMIHVEERLVAFRNQVWSMALTLAGRPARKGYF